MLKNELRKIYLARQKSISATKRKQKSERLAALFFEKFDLANIKFLHCFLPIEKFNEIETKFIFQRIWRDFPRLETLVPRVDFHTDEIENLRFTAATALVRNQWEIHEPAHQETVAPTEIDLILIPLLCFDERGFRVGYGKGFYDRLLKKCRADCLKIGLSYFAPIAEIADARDFDERLDFCLTPQKLWKFAADNRPDAAKS